MTAGILRKASPGVVWPSGSPNSNGHVALRLAIVTSKSRALCRVFVVRWTGPGLDHSPHGVKPLSTRIFVRANLCPPQVWPPAAACGENVRGAVGRGSQSGHFPSARLRRGRGASCLYWPATTRAAAWTHPGMATTRPRRRRWASARVAPAWGGEARSGAEVLWGWETMAGMAHGSFASGNRLDGEVGYGLPVGSRFVGTPRVGFGTWEYGPTGLRTARRAAASRWRSPGASAREQWPACRTTLEVRRRASDAWRGEQPQGCAGST